MNVCISEALKSIKGAFATMRDGFIAAITVAIPVAAPVAVTFAGGCIQEEEEVETGSEPVDTDTSPPVDSDTSDTSDTTDAAYTYNAATRELDIDGAYNPYKGYTVGVYCDGCGTEDGWSHAVATIPPSDDGSLMVNLGLFGNGADIRWSLALVNDDLEPTQWLWESGTVSGQLQEHDSLGLTIPVKECVGEELVTKLDFCTQISSAGIAPGTCWGTYVEPTDCSDADNDGDVDPDTGGNADDGNTDTGDDGSGSGSGDSGSSSSGSLVREVCVKESTSAYKLGYMDTGTSDRTHWVTEVSSTATVDSPILSGSNGDTGCVSVTLTGEGTTLKFNGYGSDSALWGHYLVGSGSGSSFAYTSGTTASEVEITVDDNVNGSSDSDAETATFSGYDLVWTD